MNIEQSNPDGKFDEHETSEKKLRWDEKLKEIEQLADATGRGIDEGIKETVVAFNVSGITTSQSCEGHFEVDGGHRPWPWVQVSAPDKPLERFIGESEEFAKVSEENNVPLEDLKRGHPEELYWAVEKKISQNPHAPEYDEWETKNIELGEKINKLLDEFYETSQVEDGIRLKNVDGTGGSIEISSENNLLLKFITNELTEEEKKALLLQLPKRQEEMTRFKDFLKKKYFAS